MEPSDCEPSDSGAQGLVLNLSLVEKLHCRRVNLGR